jgi:hypothetical protein
MDDSLVASVRAVYDRDMADFVDTKLPVTGMDLVTGVLVDDRGAFAAPCPPLGDVCAAAGLELRLDRVAHDPMTWENGRRLQRRQRIADEFDRRRSITAAHACDAFDKDTLTADEVSFVLSGLRDDEVLDVVATYS